MMRLFFLVLAVVACGVAQSVPNCLLPSTPCSTGQSCVVGDVDVTRATAIANGLPFSLVGKTGSCLPQGATNETACTVPLQEGQNIYVLYPGCATGFYCNFKQYDDATGLCTKC